MPNEPIGRLWRFQRNAAIMATWSRYISKGFGVFGVENTFDSLPYIYHNDQRKPDEIEIDPTSFIPPRVIFPADGFTPDWFFSEGYDFCSAAMADALAQPESVIQYLPIVFECEGEAARAKDYRIVRIRAHQRALDLQKSEFQASFVRGLKTDALFFEIFSVEKYVLLDGFTPKTELFREDEDPITHIFAMDSLAERVMKSGCTGLQFVGLDAPSYAGGKPFTVRTAKGTKVLTR